MDVDMAMQLSRARRETIVGSPFETRTPSIHAQQQQGSRSPEPHAFPSTLEEEEEELPYHLRHHHEHATSPMNVLDHEGSPDRRTLTSPQRSRSDPSLHPHLNTSTDPMMGSLIDIHSGDPSAPNYGLPTYQSNVSTSHFDFEQMEQFAAVEKANLGISTPTTRLGPSSILRRSGGGPSGGEPHSLVDLDHFGTPSTAAEPSSPPPHRESIRFSAEEQPRTRSLIDDAPSEHSTTQRALRQRKISESNSPRPRPPRKGFGGKISLFESAPTEPVPKVPAIHTSTPGLTFGSGNDGIIEPYSDYVFGGAIQGPSRIVNTTGAGQGHDRPYRFSFYSNALNATIHARSLSELPAEGQTFEDLFTGIAPPPRPPTFQQSQVYPSASNGNLSGHKDRPTSSLAFSPPNHVTGGASQSDNANSTRRLIIPEKDDVLAGNGNNGETDIKTWWLDVMCPTGEEMQMLSKVFSIHPLTTEDILMEETREKIELFRNYYLVCFRGFDQDPYSPTYLEPLNMYIIVFREGTLSFHFRPTPHPQNVRRRIKQLKDYISVTSDWISYALIDDITDAFGPLIQSIEYEVDSIDELVLILKEAEQSDMLRRIGTCRKKVMGLLRLMGNKADVVKGLAKRCNENWRVAPTSDIGLYLSDIQDHLITMTQNLNHYEKILSRSHSNYLAQISIEMTDANNQINDVLSKLTALGTVLIPMNLVTGLWGMNVHVPGQEAEGYVWFSSIIACLAAFALIGGYTTYRFMVRR